jgi:hypothetical protein
MIGIYELNTILFINSYIKISLCFIEKTASVVQWSEFLVTDPEVLGSVPGPNRFSEK